MTGLRGQAARYAAVGVGSNLTLYIAYIGLTSAGVGPKLAMTLVYALGVIASFALNKAWTFRHSGRIAASLGRYLLAYGAGYLLNLALLALFVDHLGLPHAVVQAAAILGIAALLFVLQRLWVFRSDAAATDAVVFPK